ncbi:MAG: R3H domain-containing nucleic acid-binding protein [Patescibacteria group bacterium]
MNQLQDNFQQIIELMGFSDFSVNYDSANNHLSVIIDDELISEENLPSLVNNLDCLMRLIAQKNNLEPVFVDVNNYRKKRRDLIVELAKAAARKSLAEKKEIPLPPMNAYERRIVHLELSSRPDIKTESIGEGRERYIVIRPI